MIFWITTECTAKGTIKAESSSLLGGKSKVKVKLSRYTPWRRMGGEEV
jgi:hypothetical protein